MNSKPLLVILFFMISFSVSAIGDESETDESFLAGLSEVTEFHGFYEMRGGYRLQEDKYEKDMSIMEGRFQFDLFSYFDWGDVKVKGDVLGDLVTEEGDFDLREANVFTRPTDFMDVKVGRQILTWGTGDLLFVNDLFPKDWESFFIGRDDEYLKSPSDAIKISLFMDINLDFQNLEHYKVYQLFHHYCYPKLPRLIHRNHPNSYLLEESLCAIY